MIEFTTITALEVVTMAVRTGIDVGEHIYHVPERAAPFLYYSAGRPKLQFYDLDQLALNRSLVVVPTFDTPYEPACFPLHGVERLLARWQLWRAGVEGPDSISVCQKQGEAQGEMIF